MNIFTVNGSIYLNIIFLSDSNELKTMLINDRMKNIKEIPNK